MSYKISWRIEMICKKLGIKYHSKYLHKTNFHEDAIKLNDLYYQVKQIVAEMVEIADKHNSEDLADMIWHDIHMLEHADHDMTKIATIMEQRGKNSKEEMNND